MLPLSVIPVLCPTRSNALPLIPRGQYIHLSGYNQGQPYTLLDIYQVGCSGLFFRSHDGCLGSTCGFWHAANHVLAWNSSTSNETNSVHYSCQWRREANLVVRSRGSTEASFSFLVWTRLEGVQDLKRREVVYAIKHPRSPEQLEHEQYLADVHQLTTPQIRERALVVYTSLAQFYRKHAHLDREEGKDSVCVCEKEDLLSGLHEFKIHLSAGVSGRRTIATIWLTYSSSISLTSGRTCPFKETPMSFSIYSLVN